MAKKKVSSKYVEREKFIIEKNAKNVAYGFILHYGLLNAFKQYWLKMKRAEIDAHEECLRELYLQYETAVENAVKPTSDANEQAQTTDTNN